VNPDGQLDMQQLLAAAQQMQEQLINAQQELADTEVSGTAGGGLVTARVNGQGELVDLTIKPEAIDADDLEETAQTIADLVLAAVRDAYTRAGDLHVCAVKCETAGLIDRIGTQFARSFARGIAFADIERPLIGRKRDAARRLGVEGQALDDPVMGHAMTIEPQHRGMRQIRKYLRPM